MKICMLCISLILFALPAIAETYTWEDDQGTVNFTEDLGSVPKKYRKKVKIVGEDELPSPEANVGNGKPVVKGKAEGAGGAKEGITATNQEKKKETYGGKDADAWKSEFSAANADLKAAEKQLAEYQDRTKDTGNMSRSQYLSLQYTIKSLENSVQFRKKKLDDLKKEAETAAVPADVME